MDDREPKEDVVKEVRGVLRGFNIKSCNAKDCSSELHEGLIDQALEQLKPFLKGE